MLELATADAFEGATPWAAPPAYRSARRLISTLRAELGSPLRLLVRAGDRLDLREGGQSIEILWARIEARSAGRAPADAPTRDPAEHWLALLEAPLQFARCALPATSGRRRWLLVDDGSAATGGEKVAAGLVLARSPLMSACLERCERVFVHDERDLWSFSASSFGFRTLRSARVEA